MNKDHIRPLIAVVCPEINSTVSEIIRGIVSEAMKNNTDTAFFSVFSETQDEDNNRRCEENIYTLINFENVSGVIFLDSEFWTDRLRNKVRNIIEEKCSVPVICTGSKSTDTIISAGLDMYSGDGIYETVSHLIEVHGCSDIFFLSGPKDNRISEERINGYIRAMKAHGFVPDMKNIFYGDFWYNYPAKLAERIASGRIRRPQAISCANDAMACGLIRSLASHGITVPDDILVTGYDGSEESILNSPSVATYFPPYFEQGTEYFRKLKIMLEHRKQTHPEKHHGTLSPAGSCGCFSTENSMLTLRKKTVLERGYFTDYIFRSEMNERCFMASDMESFISAVDQSSYLLPGYEHMFLCLGKSSLSGQYAYRDEYPPLMTIMLDKIEFVKVCRNKAYRTSEMLPALYDDREHPDAFFFFPVQFAGKSFGYIAVTYKDKNDIPGKALFMWVRNISAALWRISSYSYVPEKTTESQAEETEIKSADIAPKWIFELVREMRKPENFTAGVRRMVILSHVSSEHLSRTFRKYYGITPTEFVNGLKLDYAAMLIHDRKYEITDACFASGFGNISHFYHQFRKKYGCSPKQYKENELNMN